MKTGRREDGKMENRAALLRAAATGAGFVLLLGLLLAATQVTPGKRIKDYPHTNRAPDEAVFIMEHTNRAGPGPTATNLHISALEWAQQVTNPLASTVALLSVSNNIVTNATDILWTNSGGIVRLTTNGPVSIASTGLLDGLVVTQDIRFLGHGADSNRVWTATNATTGEGEWRPVEALVAFRLGLTNDPDRLILQSIPGRGALYYTGTNAYPQTNGPKAGMEFDANRWSFRVGVVSGEQWNFTNVGLGSVAFGSNNLAGGRYTTIAGGRNNITHTNVENSFIGGGINHTIGTNATNCVIGGGEQNDIQLNCDQSFIGGGSSHIIRRGGRFSTIGGGFANIATDPHGTIGGGLNNFISDESSGNVINSAAATISGGEESIARGTRSTIAGGYKHNLLSDCEYSTISGGSSNGMGIAGGAGNGTQFAVIGGGSQNAIASTAHFGSIGGGQLNIINSGFIQGSIPGGVSNSIGSSYTGIWGNWGTNSDAHTGLISYEKVTVRGRTNGTLVAGSHATVTNRVAGAGNGNTNYTLLATTSRMYLGSSNVNIVAVMRYEAGVVMPWTVYITNLSADTWGFSFSAATNRVRWQSYMYGTNAPVVLTNNTLLRLNGESEGTNTLVTYQYFSPAL